MQQPYRTVAALKAITTGIRSGDDHIRGAGYDLPGQIGITLVMPLGGNRFDDSDFFLPT